MTSCQEILDFYRLLSFDWSADFFVMILLTNLPYKYVSLSITSVMLYDILNSKIKKPEFPAIVKER